MEAGNVGCEGSWKARGLFLLSAAWWWRSGSTPSICICFTLQAATFDRMTPAVKEHASHQK